MENEAFICNSCGYFAQDIYSLSHDPIRDEYFCPQCKSYDVIEVNPDELLKDKDTDESNV